MRDPALTLDEFVAEQKKTVDEFARKWRENHARPGETTHFIPTGDGVTYAEAYPLTMTHSDWLENYLTIQQS
jgi:hypothetical protein